MICHKTKTKPRRVYQTLFNERSIPGMLYFALEFHGHSISLTVFWRVIWSFNTNWIKRSLLESCNHKNGLHQEIVSWSDISFMWRSSSIVRDSLCFVFSCNNALTWNPASCLCQQFMKILLTAYLGFLLQVYICVCVCVCVCFCGSMCACMGACVCESMYAYVSVCKCVWMSQVGHLRNFFFKDTGAFPILRRVGGQYATTCLNVFTRRLRTTRMWHKVTFKRSLTGLNFDFFFYKVGHKDWIFGWIPFKMCFGCPRGVMVKAMNCGIVVREFVLQSRYYVHFRANTLGKSMNPLILPPAMGK